MIRFNEIYCILIIILNTIVMVILIFILKNTVMLILIIILKTVFQKPQLKNVKT